VEPDALVARLATLAASAPPLSVRDLALDGAALMRLTGRPGGPWLGQLQRALLEAVLEDPALNTPEALGRLVRRHAQEA
jgi:tRNA nucleotidyltransferase (CCA-adding enzyme)